MSEPAQKCQNKSIYKANYTLQLLITFKVAYFCCFDYEGKSRFSKFSPKFFYNINHRNKIENNINAGIGNADNLMKTFHNQEIGTTLQT